jgi:MFS family permease
LKKRNQMSVSDYSDYESARNTEGSALSFGDHGASVEGTIPEIAEEDQSTVTTELHPRKLTVDEALDRVGTGRFQFYMLMIAGFAFAGDAIEVSLLTFLSPCVQSSWGLSNIDAASLASAVFGGAMVGSVILGSAADTIGRRPVYFCSCILVLGFGIASCFSLNFKSLVFTRAMVGFGIGGITSPFNLLAEILHPSERGHYLLYIEYFWCFGSFYTTLVAWLVLGPYGWRYLAALCAMPAALSLVAGLWLPESPRWLLLHNCPKEAKEVIVRMAKVNKTFEKLPPEWELEMGKPLKIDVNLLAILKPFELITSSEMRNRTILIWIVWLAFGITYFGIILLIARIFGVGQRDDDNLDDESDTCSFKSLSVLVSSTSEIVGLTVVVFSIDRLGRKGSQVWLLFVGAIASLLIGVSVCLCSPFLLLL